MKKSELRNIIRESVKQLMTEQIPPTTIGVKSCCSGAEYTIQQGMDSNGFYPPFTVPVGHGLVASLALLPLGPSGTSIPMSCWEVINNPNGPNCIIGASGPSTPSGCNGLPNIPSNNFPNNICCDSNSGGSVSGCTDSNATNYNPLATINDGSCVFSIPGCTDSIATNYNPLATVDDGSCIYEHDTNVIPPIVFASEECCNFCDEYGPGGPLAGQPSTPPSGCYDWMCGHPDHCPGIKDIPPSDTPPSDTQPPSGDDAEISRMQKLAGIPDPKEKL